VVPDVQIDLNGSIPEKQHSYFEKTYVLQSIPD